MCDLVREESHQVEQVERRARKPPDRPGGKIGVEGRQVEQVERLMPGKAGGNIGVEGRQVEYVEKCAQMASR
jgi:hypothetical protein